MKQAFVLQMRMIRNNMPALFQKYISGDKCVFRKVLFWAHLSCGVVAGFAIFTMCVTGVLLTYEVQIEDWVAGTAYVPVEEQQNRLSLEELHAIAVAQNPDLAEGSVIVDRNSGAPVTIRAGRRGGLQLNPYTGEEMAPAAPWLNAFFSDITGFHRWFNASSENRRIPRLIIGISNLMFVFIIVSGIYLWLPKIWNWAVVRSRLLLDRKGYPTSKARDFTWHHVFGIWCAIPLFILATTGSMFSFRWTGDLLYSAFGTDRSGSNLMVEEVIPETLPNGGASLSLDQLFESAESFSPDWQAITLTVPQGDLAASNAVVDRGNGRMPQLRDTLTLDRVDGEIVAVAAFETLPINQRIRSVYRFLHTGEFLGVFGQTVAGLVSLFGAIMVWTGLALAYRRLLQPLLNRRRPVLQSGNKNQAVQS